MNINQNERKLDVRKKVANDLIKLITLYKEMPMIREHAANEHTTFILYRYVMLKVTKANEKVKNNQ